MAGRRLILFVLVFDALALLILYPHIDLFAGGYLVLSTFLAVIQVVVNDRFSASEDIRRLFYARDIDRLWDKWVPVLGIAELAMFFEYAHWRPVPQLIGGPAQFAGLLLCLIGTLWLVWVDKYLISQFPAHHRSGTIMTSGPYRFVRHPRYMGLLATRIALPLLFGSIIGCVIAAAWLVLIRRRAHLEEQWLRTKFGATYNQYATHVVGIP